MKYERHWSSRVGLVGTSVGVKASSEGEAGELGTQIPPASPTCYRQLDFIPYKLWTVLLLHSTLVSPGVAEVAFIILLISVYPGDVSQRGHKSSLPPFANEDTSILTVRIKLSQKERRSSNLDKNSSEHTPTDIM